MLPPTVILDTSVLAQGVLVELRLPVAPKSLFKILRKKCPCLSTTNTFECPREGEAGIVLSYHHPFRQRVKKWLPSTPMPLRAPAMSPTSLKSNGIRLKNLQDKCHVAAMEE